MQKEKKRPSLEDLKNHPDLLQLELSQVSLELANAGRMDDAQAALNLKNDPHLTAEKVAEFRLQMQSASGSTNPGCLSQMAEGREVQ